MSSQSTNPNTSLYSGKRNSQDMMAVNQINEMQWEMKAKNDKIKFMQQTIARLESQIGGGGGAAGLTAMDDSFQRANQFTMTN